MHYSALIRKLVVASEEARYQHADIAEILKERCTADTNIIRQTLMNAVCDPRFRLHVNGIPSWSRLARERLEAFAEKLSRKTPLSLEVALDEMDEMLNEWIETVTRIAEKKERELKYSTYSLKEQGGYLRRAIERFVNDVVPDGLTDDEKENEEDPNIPSIPLDWSGESTSLSLFNEPDEEQTEEEIQKLADQETDEQDANADGNTGMGIGKGKSEHREEIEQEFLSNVPSSLIKLAQLIGRSADVEGEPTGRFYTASKSDIAGITTGNNLNCMLPSELALMADKATENIFYKNYVTRSLQLFASASHSSKSKIHHDGPIVICLDTSSSMQGEPLTVATALTFAVCIIAQRKKRKVIVVRYSDSHEEFFLSNIQKQKRQLKEFLSSTDMGGNNEDSLFRWLFQTLLPSQGDYSSADILCISDFGWTLISPEVVEMIEEEKKKHLKIFGLNIARGEDDSDPFFHSIFTSSNMGDKPGTPDTVCDSLWEYRDGVCSQVK